VINEGGKPVTLIFFWVNDLSSENKKSKKLMA
jgi:hypothetical protein